MLAENTPDAAWHTLRDVLQGTTKESFEQKKNKEESDLVLKRLDLLSQRAQIRSRFENDDIDLVKLELVMTNRRLRKLREAEQKERKQSLLNQLWEAWRSRDFSRVHKLRSFMPQNVALHREEEGTGPQHS